MKNLLKLYNKIIKEDVDEISLDDVTDIDESYIELSRGEVENMFNEELNSEYTDGMISVAGENFKPSEIIQDLRPEQYEKMFTEFCIENDIKKIDGKFYAKADSVDSVRTESEDDIVTESAKTVIKTDTYCDFEVSIVPKDKEFGYKLKDTKVGKAESPYIECSEYYNSIEAALEAAKIHINKICIKNELNVRKAKFKK